MTVTNIPTRDSDDPNASSDINTLNNNDQDINARVIINTAAIAALDSGIGGLGLFPLTVGTKFLICEGGAVSRTTYSDLYTYLGDAYGNGDGSTTFNLPDYRGYFLRSSDNGAGNDPDAGARTDRGDATTGDNVGTIQGDDFELHGHQFTTSSDPGATGAAGGLVTQNSGITNNSAHSGSSSNNSGQQIGGNGGSETRPKNIYVNIGIRAVV